jgi:hypothetical protein
MKSDRYKQFGVHFRLCESADVWQSGGGIGLQKSGQKNLRVASDVFEVQNLLWAGMFADSWVKEILNSKTFADIASGVFEVQNLPLGGMFADGRVKEILSSKTFAGLLREGD